MYKKPISLVLVALQLAIVLLILIEPVGEAQAAVNPNWPFLRVWERTDYPVAIGATQRSWYWGPSSFAILGEQYSGSPGGFRQVAYHDKSRMEISNPGGDQNSKWYVTNGLLVKELVSGQVQLG